MLKKILMFLSLVVACGLVFLWYAGYTTFLSYDWDNFTDKEQYSYCKKEADKYKRKNPDCRIVIVLVHEFPILTLLKTKCGDSYQCTTKDTYL